MSTAAPTPTSPAAGRLDLTVPALAAVVVLWASAFVGIRAVADTFGPGPLSLGRLVVGALALTLIARPWRHRMPRGRTLGLTVLYAVTWFALYNVALNAAGAELDAGTNALVVNIGPILIALGAGLLFREGLPRPLVVGMAIAFAGVVLIAISTRGEGAVQTASITGVLLAVSAAVCYAAGALAQKPTLTTVGPALSVWLGCTTAAVLCLPFAPSLARELAGADVVDVVWLVYLGVFPTAIGFAAWAYAIARLPSGRVAATTYLVPVVTTVMSWLLLGEVPAPLALAGGALCLAGVAITRRRRRRPTSRGSAPQRATPRP